MFDMTLRNIIAITVLVFFLALIAHPTTGDEIVFVNGDIITGKILQGDAKKLAVKTEHAGQMSIQFSSISTITSEAPVIIRMNDGSIISGKLLPAPEQTLRIDTAGKDIAFAEISHINPPAYLAGKGGISWRGHINGGVTITDGNTDTDTSHVDAEIVGRTRKQRQTVSGQFFYATDNDIETESRLNGLLKYDYFYRPKLFATANISAARDKFQNLDLRLIYGLGLGYQFIENESANGSFELGANYVIEDKTVGEDSEYPALYWNTRYDTYLVNRSLQFFHIHNLSVGLKHSEDMLAKIDTGLRLFFLKNTNATIKVQYEWDNTPAEGKNRSDTVYLLTIGYAW